MHLKKEKGSNVQDVNHSQTEISESLNRQRGGGCPPHRKHFAVETQEPTPVLSDTLCYPLS